MPTRITSVHAQPIETRSRTRSTSRRTPRGVGKGLLNALIERCTALGLRQMLAVIGDAENAASIGVHRRCGFDHTGVMKAVGRKFDRWVDVVIMQRALGPGSSAPPG